MQDAAVNEHPLLTYPTPALAPSIMDLDAPAFPEPVLAEPSDYPDEAPMEALASAPAAETASSVTLDGVVFTTILTPKDGRKNLEDMLTAFVDAFQKTDDATLVVKMIGANPSLWWWDFYNLMSRLPVFECRIVVLHGYLTQERYDALIGATSWIVNASLAEGLCLPLMEFMSVGRPAIAPSHTAMADYIHPTNAIIVSAQEEYCSWPQDPRMKFTTTRHRVEWPSVRAAFLEAYSISKMDPIRYRTMAQGAMRSMREFCSDDVVAARLASFLGLDGGAAGSESSSDSQSEVRSADRCT
jgi:hypothetical protein